MNKNDLYDLVDEYYNRKYSDSYGEITHEAADLYYEVYGNDFQSWLIDVNDETANQIVLFAMVGHNKSYDKIIDELDKNDHFNPENTTLTKQIVLNRNDFIINDDSYINSD